MAKFNLVPEIYVDSCIHRVYDSYSNCRIFIVCDSFLVENPVARKIVKKLREQNEVMLFSDVVPDPPLPVVIDCVKKMIQFFPNILVAIGGGSAIDTAKASKYFSQKISENIIEDFIVAPSTSGSGSEVTSFAVVTDSEEGKKYPLIDDSLLPTKVTLIPQLVCSCPSKTTAYSGLDVLTHALEALVAKGANGFTDPLAVRAIKLVFRDLKNCVVNPNDLKARRNLMEASTLAGIAFQNAGLGLVHAISHQIGGKFHLPHGLINSILLPKIVSFNSKDSKVKHKFGWMSKDMDLIPIDGADITGTIRLNDAIKSLTVDLGCPQNLRGCGIEPRRVLSQLDKIVDDTLDDPTYTSNPIEASREDLVSIILSIL